MTSPLETATRVDFAALYGEADESGDWLSRALQAGAPRHRTGVDLFFRRPEVRYTGYAVHVVAFIGLVNVIPWLLPMLVLSAVFGVFEFRCRKRKSQAEVTLAQFLERNPEVAADMDTSRGHSMGEVFGLERGDRKVWLDPRLRISGKGGQGAFEAGTYNYETRSKDDKGREEFRTRSIDYLFVPFPSAVGTRVGDTAFTVTTARLWGRHGTAGTAGAFDQWCRVTTKPKESAEATLAAAQVLSSDVQLLMVRYAQYALADGAKQLLDLRLRRNGIWIRAHRRPTEGVAWVRLLFEGLRLAHEMLEQIDPAYKSTTEEQALLRARTGLEPV